MKMAEYAYTTRPTLAVCWRDGQAVALEAVSGRTCEINQDTIAILNRCASGATAVQVTEALRADGYDVTADEVGQTLAELAKAGLLCDGEAVGGPDAWSRWTPEAMLFHFGTKDLPYVNSPEQARQVYEEITASAPPALFKRYPNAPIVILPRPRPADSPRFTDVLLRRRTIRSYQDTPVDVEQLSAVLHYSFAPQQFADLDGLGALPLRTYANGGARSELEIYLNARGVSGLDDGLYHYGPISHCLEFLREPLDKAALLHLSHQQSMCGDAPVTLFVTGVVGRVAHKYHNARALRVIYMDAGHLGQNFALVATAYGLGPYQTAAFRDSEVEQTLGIDGRAETALYMLGMGVPAADPAGRLRPAGLSAAAITTLYDDHPAHHPL
ncbi:SagB/ThcOx family dehydrogenase [Nonomuraea sp. H19]|uniref:SagB/ThcOx family dehydrogenase n=1 Tax=Nonomuraea sp. H19 TaxID=3452206 RepID=UPI003F898079